MSMLIEAKDIIIADDDEEDVEIFKTGLQEAAIPHTLRHAANSVALFHMLSDKVPNILFLDVHMPCVDGRTCLLQIRQNSQYDNLPIVMCTTFSSQDQIREFHNEGASLFMIKPSTIQAMVMSLKKVFSTDWKNGVRLSFNEFTVFTDAGTSTSTSATS